MTRKANSIRFNHSWALIITHDDLVLIFLPTEHTDYTEELGQRSTSNIEHPTLRNAVNSKGNEAVILSK